MEIREIVALVTGANRGIGRAIVEQLVADGAKDGTRVPLPRPGF